MKRKMCIKSIICMTLAMLLVVAVAVPATATGFDMDAAIAEFELSPFNSETLEVGQSVSHLAAIWTNNTMAECYSSDNTIVTVDAKGEVTAVGKGRAYVAIVVSGSMYELCRYDVVSYDEPENNSTHNNETESSPTEKNEPVSNPPKKNEAVSNTPEKNETVTNAPEKNESLSNAIEKQQDFINQLHSSNLHQIQYATANHRTLAKHQRTRMVFLVFLALILSLVAYTLGSIIYLSSASMKAKRLPEVRHTANTVTKPMPPRQYCLQCGQVYGSADFCPNCGSPKAVPNSYVVPINGRMTARKLETVVNEWLAENPYAYNCKLKLETKASLLIPFAQWKFFVKKAEIEFSVADQPQYHQYGLAFIYKFRLFGPIGYSQEKHVAQWQLNNPDCQVVSTQGGRIQHFDSNGGFWAEYYNYVFFKKN